MIVLRGPETIVACLILVLTVGTIADAADKPLRVGGDVKAPAVTKHVNPVYPEEAKAKGIEGTVLVEAVVGPTGKVEDAKVKRSNPLFDQAALDVVKQWEFKPTIDKGRARSVLMSITVNFRMS